MNKKNLFSIICLFIIVNISLTGQSETIKPKAHIDYSKSEVFIIVEEMPRFPGCQPINLIRKELRECSKALLDTYLSKKINTKTNEKGELLNDEIEVNFIIDEFGKLNNIEFETKRSKL